VCRPNCLVSHPRRSSSQRFAAGSHGQIGRNQPNMVAVSDIVQTSDEVASGIMRTLVSRDRSRFRPWHHRRASPPPHIITTLRVTGRLAPPTRFPSGPILDPQWPAARLPLPTPKAGHPENQNQTSDKYSFPITSFAPHVSARRAEQRRGTRTGGMPNSTRPRWLTGRRSLTLMARCPSYSLAASPAMPHPTALSPHITDHVYIYYS